MTLQNYIATHPLIKWNAIERKLGIPKGSIRRTGKRKVPKKYVAKLEMELIHYGYNNSIHQLGTLIDIVEVDGKKIAREIENGIARQVKLPLGLFRLVPMKDIPLNM